MTDVAPDPAADARRRRRLVTSPNALTVLRLVAGPGVRACCCSQRRRPRRQRWRAAGATLVLRARDHHRPLDGEIARKRGLVTEFGKLADPIADKALIGAALIGLSMLGDAAVVGHRRDPGPRGRRHPAALLGHPARRDRGQPRRQGQDRAPGARDRPVHPAAGPAGWPARGWWVMAVAVVLTVVTGIDYVYRALTLRQTSARAMQAAAARRAAGPSRQQRRPHRHRRLNRPPMKVSGDRRSAAGRRRSASALGSTPTSRRRMLRKASYCRWAAIQSPAAWCASISAAGRSPGAARPAPPRASPRRRLPGRPGSAAAGSVPRARAAGAARSRSRTAAPSRRTSRAAAPARRSAGIHAEVTRQRRVAQDPGRPASSRVRSTSTSSARPSQDCSAVTSGQPDLLQPPQRRAQVAGGPPSSTSADSTPAAPGDRRRPGCRAR